MVFSGANYAELKQTALSCRSKDKGKMINYEFRLHYNPEDETVTMYNRLAEKEKYPHINQNVIIAVTTPDELTTIHTIPEQSYSSISCKLFFFYNVRLNSNTTPSINWANPKNIIDRNGGRHVYVAGKTVTREGLVVVAPNYDVITINPEWNKQLTQLSKKRRRSLMALHKVMPNNSTYATDKGSKSNNLTDLILYAPVNASTVIQIRRLLQDNHNKSNLRADMQKHINSCRMDLANNLNKTTVESHVNECRYPKNP